MVDKSLKYLETHEWARMEGDGNVSVGLSDHAYEQLGDIVFIELPEVGKKVSKGETFGVIESVKAASDMYAPVGGEVVEVNKQLEDDVESLAGDAYGNWLIKIKLADDAEYDGLLDGDAYSELVE